MVFYYACVRFDLYLIFFSWSFWYLFSVSLSSWLLISLRLSSKSMLFGAESKSFAVFSMKSVFLLNDAEICPFCLQVEHVVVSSFIYIRKVVFSCVTVIELGRSVKFSGFIYSCLRKLVMCENCSVDKFDFKCEIFIFL